METFQFDGVDLAELLPRIPGEIKNGLPFGLVKLDTQGNILEYNMAEGELTGVDPNWAVGRNFFDEVAICTKTQAFYGRFVEGVKKGFINTVFDYIFDHRDVGVKVRVHMVMVPDHLGRKVVMLLVKRSDKPVVIQATPDWPPKTGWDQPVTAAMPLETPSASAVPAAAGTKPAAPQPNLKDVVEAVMKILNQGGTGDANSLAQAAIAQMGQAAAAPAAMPAPAPAPAPSAPKNNDILKF
jgi:photoactive yellow protein